MKTGDKTQSRATRLEDVRGLFRIYAERVREHFGDRVDRIWLYGSAARGDWTAQSDIDVLVILDEEQPGDLEWLVRVAYRVGLAERHLLLQPILLTTDAFEQLVAKERRFALDVLREGIAA
ncbi:MAG: nucleotidyltransferase domain-containing protein [Kiritimatiellae bacterium]|nr:nucleotidyltransferase domain-containing protein [Kiritimatiellia bacterium]